LGLMLALARQIPQADASLRKGEWRKSELVGHELFGKTLGIIGVGRIGTAVAERAHAMGMDVLGYDPLVDDETILRRGGKPVGLIELLQASDFISLHVPLTPETHGLIDDTAMKKMKAGARLISTSRGAVVDEDALLKNLDNGHLEGAALDVFAREPADNTALLQHPRMINTPHIGAQTDEARTRTSTGIAVEVLAALNQETLRWQVN
jgi:D-3-phosphoglycerate dehydrogenase